MNQKDTRWRQRFSNFERAYKQLSAAVEQFEKLNTLEKEGLIQRFEYTFELAWKTLKDLLEAEYISLSFPREVIKAAFQHQLIKDGELWMDMLGNRNLLAHTYEEKRFLAALEKIISEYYPALTQVYEELRARL
ncbi:MAG: nucleotidyltransferase substrate binding protein [Limnochordia bacterium]|jgi:nucleotidyltransferase substrate binding protein (TIGR01987 family)|nr:nucleotidyltransferase substrate binding protein [Limnochordia bacterium]